MTIRTLALLLILALTVPASAQTIYALRVATGGSVPPLPSEPPRLPIFELIQITSIPSSQYVTSTTLVQLPPYPHIAAFDTVRQRAFLTVQGDDHLYVADVQARSVTRSNVVTTGRTFAFDSAHETLYAGDGAGLLAVDLAGGTTTTIVAADRTIVLCGLDSMRGRAFVSDPGGGELRYVDLNSRTLSSPLLTVDSSISVMAETEKDVLDIVYNNNHRNDITRFDMTTWMPAAITNMALSGISATTNALDTLSGHLFAIRGEDWNLLSLVNVDVRNGTVSGAYLAGDYAQVVVVQAAPPKRRATRAH